MAGGTLGFIAEIADGGKLNLPANSFPVYNGNVNGGRVSIFFECLRRFQGGPRTGCLTRSWYFGTLVPTSGKATMVDDKKFRVQRVQTGVRMEERILKVLKAFAEYHDMTLGDLLEGIVLHTFDGKCPFGADSLKRIKDLKEFYGLDLDSRASHGLTESRAGHSLRKNKPGK
jgi:hypothetical protein